MNVRSVTALVASAAIVIGCGGRQRTRLGSEQTDIEIVAPGPSAAQYETAPPPGDPVRGGGDQAAVIAGMEHAAREQNMALEGDPRLAALAEWIGDRLGPNGDPPTAEVIDFLGHHLGLAEPTPHVLVLGLPDQVAIAEHLRQSASQYLARQSYTHWGASIRPRSGVWLIVVVLSWRHAAITPIPRAVLVGTSIQMQGRLDERFQNPTVVVQPPGLAPSRLPAGSGPEFDVRVPTTGSGVYQVELLGRGPLGESVIVNAPVYVGMEPPNRLRVTPEEDLSGPPPEVAEVRARLLERLNETRAEVSLPPLRDDPELERIASAHSQDMISHNFIGHQSPRTGTPADRVHAGGIRSGLILENIGRGYSAREIHEGLMDSPGHRANIVNRDATHVGIGVVAQTENGRTAFVATEVFIQVAEPIDTRAAPDQLLSRLNGARRARGAPELERDQNLDQAAQEAADAYFANPSLTRDETVSRATEAVRRFAIVYRRIGGIMGVVSSVEEASQLEPALVDTVRHCGIGVAQGTRPDSPPNAIAVVILLAWER